MPGENLVLALRVTAGGDAGRIFPLAEGLIGSSEAADIHLSDKGVSPVHARITQRKDSWNITDLTSAPDLRVNNSIVKSRKIQYGDTISIGSATLQIVEAPRKDETPLRFEAKKAHSERIDTPPSQTMQISIEGNVHDWKPGKPEAREFEHAHQGEKQHKATTESLKSLRHRHSASPYRSIGHESHPSVGNSGSRTLVYVLLIVAIIAPLLAGGIYLSDRKHKRRELALAYQAAKDFEMRNPFNFRESIDLYRKMQILAAGSNPNLAITADENIKRLETMQQKQIMELEGTLADLDKRSTILSSAGDYQGALGVYENYIGKLSAEVAEARKAEIIKLRTQAGSASGSSSSLHRPSALPSSAVKAESPLSKSGAATALMPDFDMHEYISAAADALIAGNLEQAEGELRKVFSATSVQTHHLAAKQSLLTVQQLRAAAELAAKASGSDVPADISEDQSQPPVTRLVYYLRKNDLFAAQVMAGKVDDAPLSKELAARARMSADQLKIEKAVIAEFVKIWSSFTGQAESSIPSPSECVRMLRRDDGKSDETGKITELCREMMKLKSDNSSSHFITRYNELFAECRNICTQLTEKSAKDANAGNAVIIEIEKNSCFFETSSPMPDPKTAKVGLIRENQVFYEPGTTIRTATIIEIITTLPFKSISSSQGVFEIPDVFTFKRPEKNDRILISADLNEKCMVVPLREQQGSSVVYAPDFNKPLEREWAKHGGIAETSQGILILDMTRAKYRCPAGTPDFALNRKMGSGPLNICFTATLSPDTDFVVMLDKVQYALTSRQRRPAGTFFDGSRTSTINLSPIKSETPVDIEIYWTPLYSILKAGGQVITAPVDLRRPASSLDTVGFALTGKISIDKFSISEAGENNMSMLAGITSDKRSVLLRKPPDKEWQDLQPGHTVFISNLVSASPKSKTAEETTINTVISAVYTNHIVARIEDPSRFSGRNVKASLSDRNNEAVNPAKNTPAFLPATGWNPPAYRGTISTNTSLRMIIPDIAGSYAADGCLINVSGLITNPYTKEPFGAYVEATRQVTFTESSGLLRFAGIDDLPVAAGVHAFVLSGAPPPGKGMMPLLSTQLSMSPLLFPQPSSGWKVISGNWTRKLNRLLSPSIKGAPSAIESQFILKENCQYNVDIKIETPASTTNRSEVIIELFSPLWQRALSMETGSNGTKFDSDGVSAAIGETGTKSAIFDPKSGIVLKKEKAFERSDPVLSSDRSYQLTLRRANGKFAFYIDGRRFATVNYPGMSGELVLRIACMDGQISLGTGMGMLLSRSIIIPDQEPDLGEFGYVLAVEGASILLDTDGFRLSTGDTVSVMKTEKVVSGENSKTIMLKRVALGKITDMNPRRAIAVTSSLIEPIQAGMKILEGQQPDTLTLSSDDLSVNK